ncbi:uncharacterized protein TNCV_4638371 [Trichonephila clavipes]|uniref:Uncharacterized protein n=1 Tax=Trichonephila clavipes TaxID=2585209 RepID=A0A8X7BI83_TRICX|nr:uncharacterized protein TNCV_4638371 [Trichonephila clavipes]
MIHIKVIKFNYRLLRVQYFVRGGFVGHLSRASSKHLSPHLPVDGDRFLGGQKGVALQVQDARVGVGSTKKPTPLDVDVRRSDVTVSSPICCTCVHYSAIAADKNFTLTSFVKMGTSQ